MGKDGYVRITNKSKRTVTVAIDERRMIEADGLDSLNGTLEPRQSLPAEGGEDKFSNGSMYQHVEYKGVLQIQKDGFIQISAAADGHTFRARLHVDPDKWWATSCDEAADHEHDGKGVVITTDVDEDEKTGEVRLEVRIYEAIPTVTWMAHLEPSLKAEPLSQVALPGTHDSGTYAWKKELGASPDSDLTVTIEKKLDVLGRLGDCITDGILKLVFERMCKCQDMSIKDQLEAGIRYLDLRVARHEESNEYYSCHGVFCVNYDEILDEIANFLTANPKEIVVLDFNHFYAMDEEHHQAFSAKIVEKLDGKMAIRGEVEANSPVQQYWDKGAQAVCIYHNDIYKSTDGKFWHRGVISSPWPNKNKTDELHENLQERIKARNKDYFFVLQGILTPDGELIKDEILESGGETSIKSIASRVSNRVVDWVEDEWKEENHNIVIVDFFHDCSMVQSILNLNKKQD